MHLNIWIGIAATGRLRTILRGVLVPSKNHLLLIRAVLVASWSDRPPASHSFDLIFVEIKNCRTLYPAP